MSDLTKRMQHLLHPIHVYGEISSSTLEGDPPITDKNPVNPSTCQPSRPIRAQNDGVNLRQPPSTFENSQNAVPDKLLVRLRSGSIWLAAQHQAWVEDKTGAVSDERFSTALDAWDLLERTLRQVFGYEGCVFGPSSRCPAGAPVVCDFCAECDDENLDH